MPDPLDNPLGTFLRDRRTRLDPVSLGFIGGRRRTKGLRREEVAQRANISPTWYTWLEQGRGGAPSADVLNRIAAGLLLTEPEREHLFMLALGRLPEVRYRSYDGVTPRLQRVLDALGSSPALVRTALWDVVAWNEAAAAVFTDYGLLPPAERNILHLMFANARVREHQDDWEKVARFVVGAFRADVARAGATAEIGQFVEDLARISPEFEAMWLDNDVRAHGDGIKRIHHADLGVLDLEYSAFAVDGRPDLHVIVYNAVSAADAERIRERVEVRRAMNGRAAT